MPVPAVAAQSLEKEHRSAGEHRKGQHKGSPAKKSVSLGAQLKCLYANARCMGNKQEVLEMCACLQGYELTGTTWRCGGMAPMTGVLEWKDTGFLGRTGRGDEAGVLPSMSVTSWRAWSSAWGWMRR